MNDKITNLIRLFESVIKAISDKRISFLLFSIINISIACGVLFLRNLEVGAWLLGIFIIMDGILLAVAHECFGDD